VSLTTINYVGPKSKNQKPTNPIWARKNNLNVSLIPKSINTSKSKVIKSHERTICQFEQKWGKNGEKMRKMGLVQIYK
jgi:hypothetical protein